MKKKRYKIISVTFALMLAIVGCTNGKDDIATESASVSASVTNPQTDAQVAKTEATETSAIALTTRATSENTTAEPTQETTIASWRQNGGFIGDYKLTDERTVCLQKVMDDEAFGYAVYDTKQGERVGTLMAPGHVDWFFEKEIRLQDINEDGAFDLVIPVNGELELNYIYAPYKTWPDSVEGCFELTDENGALLALDLTTYPYENIPHPVLTERQKLFYEEMCPKILNFEPFEYDVETYGHDGLDDVLLTWGYLSDDYPQIDCYFTLHILDNEEGVASKIRSSYSTLWEIEPKEDIDAVRSNMEEFEAEADRIVGMLTESMTAYQKYLTLARMVSLRADYDYEHISSCAHSPWAGVMGGYCVCEGYSKAMEYLCKKAGLYCKFVSGEYQNVAHAWNLLKIPEGTYHADITWSDTATSVESEEWMRYFMLTQEQICVDHIISDGTIATGM